MEYYLVVTLIQCQQINKNGILILTKLKSLIINYMEGGSTDMKGFLSVVLYNMLKNPTYPYV